jgi:hypothetical protein
MNEGGEILLGTVYSISNNEYETFTKEMHKQEVGDTP